MEYPLLSDLTKQISIDYDVLLADAGVALRGLFIIDPNGVIRQKTINDLPVGRSVDETLRLLQAFQFVDKHGEGKIFNTKVPLYRDRELIESIFLICCFSLSGQLECEKELSYHQTRSKSIARILQQTLLRQQKSGTICYHAFTM